MACAASDRARPSRHVRGNSKVRTGRRKHRGRRYATTRATSPLRVLASCLTFSIVCDLQAELNSAQVASSHARDLKSLLSLPG